jgi:hypothetical protein
MTGSRPRIARLAASLVELLRLVIFGWLEVLRRELPTFKAIVLRRLEAIFRERPRRDSARRCMPVHAKVYRRPDPLIYSQLYLMQQGLAVTWDNPDIRIEKAGVPVPAHDLAPDTEYTIVARVWNGSTNAPAIHMPVRFTVFGFGIGTQGQPVGETHVDLGVKGSAACPAFAAMQWRTPATPGHYCIQVLLIWSDDANPLNNLGQTNTSVRPLNSPRAMFELLVGNPERELRTVRLEADGYRLPPPERCPERPQQLDAPERRRRLLERHGRRHHPVPEGWRVAIEPQELALEPGEERLVVVTLTAPTDDFAGRVTVNVNGFAGDEPVGGVTLYAEGRAHG